MQNKFIIITPFYNVANFILECVESVKQQSYQNYVIIFADDNSSDGTLDKIEENPKFIKYRNSERKTALENIHNSLIRYDKEYGINPDDIIVGLDGDDRFLHTKVLEYVNDMYNKTNCLLTYGQYVTSTNYMGHCSAYNEVEYNNLRNMDWRASHLRTFKWKLYQEMMKQDSELKCYLDDDNTYYKITYDIAIMYPLMEIAGYKNIVFNTQPLYWYRLHNNNDHIIDASNQKRVEHHIRNKTKFKQIF